MEGSRGENRQVILVGPELFRFPRVWEGLGVQLRVAKHFLEFGVVGGAVDRGVKGFPGWVAGWSGPWWGMVGGTVLGGKAYWLGWGGVLTTRREALWGGRRGRGVRGGGCGVSGGARGCHTM